MVVPVIRADQIPPEVVEAAAKELAYTNGWRNHQGIEVCKPVVKDVIAAALNAWPGMHTGWQCIGCGDDAQIILPLPQGAAAPQEARDE